MEKPPQRIGVRPGVPGKTPAAGIAADPESEAEDGAMRALNEEYFMRNGMERRFRFNQGIIKMKVFEEMMLR
jgi:hypothetical protein